MTDETREIVKEVALAATPEEVWAAVATGPGITCWFVPCEVEPRVGGTITQDFGMPGKVEGEITAWEPGRRFAFGAKASVDPSAGIQAFEYLISGGEGGTTILRLIHSGFSTDAAWDDEYDAVDKGWDIFLGVLGVYLSHFKGQPGASATAMSFAQEPRHPAAERLFAALGLESGAPSVGDRVRLVAPGATPLAGTVDASGDGVLGVLLEEPAGGVARLAVEGPEAGPVSVAIMVYLYGDDAAATAAGVGPGWQAAVSELFPPPAPVTS